MNFKKSLACTLAVLTLTTSSPLNSGNINVYAAKTSVSSSVSTSTGKGGKSFAGKAWDFVKKHKWKFIVAAAVVVVACVGGGIYLYNRNKSNQPNEPNKDSEPPKENAGDEELNTDRVKPSDIPGHKWAQDPSGVWHDVVIDKDYEPDVTKRTNVNEKAAHSTWNEIGNWFDKNPVFGKAIFATSLGGFALSGIKSFFSGAGELGEDIQKVISPYGFFGTAYDKIKRKMDSILYPSLPVNPKSSSESLELLFKDFKGQDEAKEKLRTHINDIVTKKDMARRRGETYSHGDVLYFIGPSGVGKSYAAKGLAKYKILGSDAEPYFMSSSDVDLKNKEESLVAQIFGPKAADFGFGDGGAKKMKSSLYRYIQDHPNGIVIIDEYDKFYDDSLDEVMRGIIDNGKVHVYNQELDCSGITFILTSNETKASLNQSGEEEMDASLTEHIHDKSFTNRIRLVEFENLPIQTYKDIASSQFVPVLKEYFAHEDCGGINLIVDDQTIGALAEKTRAYGEGARHLLNYLFGEASSVITEFLSGKSNEDFKNANGKDVVLKFVLKDIDDKELKAAKEDREGQKYKLVSGAYKYKLDDIEPEEIELAKNDKDFKQYVKINKKEYKKYRLLDLSPEEEKIAKEHISSKLGEKLYVKLQGYKKRKLEDITPEEKELILKDQNYILQNKDLYVKIGGECKKYKLLDVSSKEEKIAKKDRKGLYVKVGDKYKKYELENVTSDEEEDINFEEESDIYVKSDVYKKYDLQEIKPEEEIPARKDTNNKFFVIKDPVYKKYIFKAEFK